MVQPDGGTVAVVLHATVCFTDVDVPRAPVAVTVYDAVVAVKFPKSVHDCSVELVQVPPPATVHAQLVAPGQLATSVMGLPMTAALGPTMVQTGAELAAHMLPAAPDVVGTSTGAVAAPR